jgi:hypothetical protein
MIAGASPDTNNLIANLEILSCEGKPVRNFVLNHRGQPNLAAVGCLSYLPRHAWQFGNVHRDKERLVAQQPPQSSAFVSVIGVIAATRTSNRGGR